MAAHPLVEQAYRELPTLISLSLRRHNIPVRIGFWLHSVQTGQWRIVVLSPLVDTLGARAAFDKVTAALHDESFASELRLSDLVLIGEQGAAEIEAAIKRGTFRLPSFGAYEDVEIYPVPNAKEINKQGFLHFSLSDSTVLVSFGAFDRGGTMKTKRISAEDVSNFLRSIDVTGTQMHEVAEAIRNNRSISIIVQMDLQKAYDAGLI